jgi:hypothetical protein
MLLQCCSNHSDLAIILEVTGILQHNNPDLVITCEVTGMLHHNNPDLVIIFDVKNTVSRDFRHSVFL